MTHRASIKNPLSDPQMMAQLLELEEQLADNSYGLKTIQDVVSIYTVI